MLERVAGDPEFDRHVDETNRFERMLADERALILELWFHLSKADQSARLKK
ncbi:MAG: hypothetical protein EXQ91_09265, partial [Alphaproteobacteria bacterium]|nr:hypothetical protein [Alphaproteobacteria bacterium]